MKNLISEKIQQAISILKEKNIDMWLTFVRETGNIKDPCLDLIVGTGCTWQSAFIITKNGDTIAILGSLDVANLKDKKIYKDVFGYVKSIQDMLVKTIGKLNPYKIAINYSRSNCTADGLTHGMYLDLCDYLKDTQFLNRLISSEDIISALRGRKTESEIELMKEAIRITLEIFDKVTKLLKPGLTEKEVADFILTEVKNYGVTPAWDIEHCPAVFSGPETAGAHAGPTNRTIERGHLLNIDFGVRYKDYCSDLQRTWYICKEGEDKAPPAVQKGFDVIVNSIKKSANAIKPGKHGVEIDDVARSYIMQNGFDEYPHALGHQIGRTAHDGGGLFAPRWQKYNNLPFMPIEKGQVYTIEPRLMVAEHGIATIEEEVLVKDDGIEYLSTPQEKLILIK